MTPLTDESKPITPAPGSANADAAAYARLHPVPDIFALGDCCANPHTPLPALAQVAEQQVGARLARLFGLGAPVAGCGAILILTCFARKCAAVSRRHGVNIP